MNQTKAGGSVAVPVDLTQAVAIYTPGGKLRLIKSNVQLTLADGTLIKPAGMNVNLVSAEGYKLLASRAGLQTLSAHTVVVDGVDQKNPHVERDAVGQPLCVTCRSFCMGYTSVGVPLVVDRTVSFDLAAYRALDLVGKVKWQPEVFRLADAEGRPPKGWSAYPIDGVVSVHVKRQEKEALA